MRFTPQVVRAPGVTPVNVSPSYSFHGLDPNFVPPFAHEMNLSLEQSLPGKISLQVGYVGTRGMRLPVFLDAKLVGQTPHGLATYNVQDASNNITKTITVPVYLPTDRRPARNSAGQQLRASTRATASANTWYNSLAVTVRRPFANGLESSATTRGHTQRDDGQVQGANGTFYGGDVPTDPNNIRFDNGPSDIDIRNRGSITLCLSANL